jgi:DTW domain-containing protein YfiP
MHWAESHRSSNTGRLVRVALADAEVALRGSPRIGPATICVRADEAPAVVLYPSDDAIPIAEWARRHGAPRTLVVPDGTWTQARKCVYREPALARLPAVTVGTGDEVAQYRLRRPPRLGRFGTAEAIALALAALDDPGAGPLLSAFETFVERSLKHRGRRTAKGLPATPARTAP